jgi:cell division protein FtsQ
VIRQSSNTTRPLVWEDEAPAESRFRRVQQGAPPPGRALPGMPVDMTDADADASSYSGGGRSGGQRFDGPGGPWWRPASAWGRVFLAVATLVVLGGLAVPAFLLKTYLGRDGRFRIAGAGNIEATGLTEVSRAEMLPVFGEDIGRNIFFVPLSERRRQLEQIPWIERATVMRLLPDQIRVSVVERQPVAFTRQRQQIGLVDANGVLLTMPAAMMAQHHYSFPVVTGIDGRDPQVARRTRMAVYGRLLAELDSNGQRLSEQISEIDLTDPEDARVRMPEQGADILAHFGEDRFLERYQRYKEHIAEWRQQYPKLVAVDLRYDQQVVLEMAPGANVAQAAADEQTAANAVEKKQPALQAAEKGQIASELPEKHTSGAKAPVDSAGSDARAKALAYQSPPTAKVKPGKAGAKPGAKGSTKPKNATAQKNAKALKAAAAEAKATQDKKKRAEAKRAALNVSKRKTAPTARPATAAGQGQ